ncbi:MAG: aconitase X catalytic domain-containing protein [Anaerolineae bacterium]|nr:aconitase X catalytic domain-containing protein [Anaerolineae bacterium]
MNLTAEEQAWLAGDAGSATRRAMEIVVALGNIYGAERLLPVESVQISGVSYRNIGAAGLDFLRRWADEGAQVHVPTTLNPTAMDLQDWQTQGISPDFAAKQQAVVDAFAHMGVGRGAPASGRIPIPTCTPYLIGNRPQWRAGQPPVHIAWAESSAVAFANAVLGARTNREGGPGALAAAITGKTGAYGLHLDQNRRPTLRVTVKAHPRTPSDYSALGAWVGQTIGRGVPYFENLPLVRGDSLWEECLKALGAAMAATGAVGLYHVAGVTPEADLPTVSSPPADLPALVVDDLAPGYALLDTPDAPVELVWIGCPHASPAEIAQVTEAVRGKRLTLPLWITCARPVKEAAIALGHAGTLHDAGAHLFADACLAIAPVRDMGFRVIATPSAKGAYYLRNLANVTARFLPLEACIDMALKTI